MLTKSTDWYRDRQYHLDRKLQCEEMARQAASPAARAAHESLAAEHGRHADRQR